MKLLRSLSVIFGLVLLVPLTKSTAPLEVARAANKPGFFEKTGFLAALISIASISFHPLDGTVVPSAGLFFARADWRSAPAERTAERSD